VECAGAEEPTDGEPEPLLVAGGLQEARTQLGRRVRWLGGAGAAMVVWGEVLAVWLSPATLPIPGV